MAFTKQQIKWKSYKRLKRSVFFFRNITIFAKQLYWNHTLAWVQCKFTVYFQNTFCEEHFWRATSGWSFSAKIPNSFCSRLTIFVRKNPSCKHTFEMQYFIYHYYEIFPKNRSLYRCYTEVFKRKTSLQYVAKFIRKFAGIQINFDIDGSHRDTANQNLPALLSGFLHSEMYIEHFSFAAQSTKTTKRRKLH